jgi:hypothetical protein
MHHTPEGHGPQDSDAIIGLLADEEIGLRSRGLHDHADMIRQYTRALETGQLEPRVTGLTFRLVPTDDEAAAAEEQNRLAKMFAGANGQVKS